MNSEWNYQNLLATIHDTFDLIARNENLLRMHQQYEDSPFIIEQYEELKIRYINDLLELLQEMNIPLKISA